jgi:hypothetical protein
MRNLLLLDRYFGQRETRLKEAERAQEEISARADRQREFVECRYMPEFLEILESWLSANEPNPDTHENMLFKSGVRKGVLLVRQHIEAIVRTKKETSDA